MLIMGLRGTDNEHNTVLLVLSDAQLDEIRAGRQLILDEALVSVAKACAELGKAQVVLAAAPDLHVAGAFYEKNDAKSLLAYIGRRQPLDVNRN